MKAQVNTETCIGCALCTQVCPEIFRMDGEKAIAYVNPVPKAVEKTCRQAAEDCPVVAITIQE
ncbi:MAG: ferredoxin [Candidatus Omnitrophota bacterium]|jgi:ferredoxin